MKVEVLICVQPDCYGVSKGNKIGSADKFEVAVWCRIPTTRSVMVCACDVVGMSNIRSTSVI